MVARNKSGANFVFWRFMKNSFKTSFVLFFLLACIVAKAQERVSIVDPEITFSYLLPEGYAYTDDPYYHYVYPISGSKDHLPRLSLTYFDKTCPNLDDCFDGKLNGDLRTQYADFKVIEKNNLILNAAPASMATYTFTEKETNLAGILCTFLTADSYFVIEAQYRANESATYQSVFKEIIKSIEVVKR